MTSETIKVGPVELTAKDCERAVADGKGYLVTYRTIYQLMHSVNAGWHGLKLYTERGSMPLTLRGRFVLASPEHAASLSHGLIAC